MSRFKKSSPSLFPFILILIAAFWFFDIPDLLGWNEEQPAQTSSEESFFNESDGYILQFSPEFESGMNYIDDFGISIVLAIDVSGSMNIAPATGGERKYIQAARSVEHICDYIDDLVVREPDLLINIGIITFDDITTMVLPLTRMDEGGRAEFRRISEDPLNFRPNKNTAIGAALEKGSEMLAASGTILNTMFIVTDGKNNNLPYPEDVLNAIYSNRNSASTEEYPVRTDTQLVTIIGFDINDPVFDTYKELGSRVVTASDQAELQGILQNLLEADITKLE